VKRLTISLNEEAWQHLRRMAFEDEVSIAEEVRRMVDAELAMAGHGYVKGAPNEATEGL
jgi:hypothetical protein